MRTLFLAIVCFITAGAFASEAKLRVYRDDQPTVSIKQTSSNKEIASELKQIGVRFEQWKLRKLPEGATNEDVLKAYDAEVSQLKQENGFQSVDVVKLAPDNPNKDIARKKFLNEHTHKEDEVRFFVEGTGTFYLHANDNVYVVCCEAGDLISVPANYKHWFDMSSEPSFTAIRFFYSQMVGLQNLPAARYQPSFQNT